MAAIKPFKMVDTSKFEMSESVQKIMKEQEKVYIAHTKQKQLTMSGEMIVNFLTGKHSKMYPLEDYDNNITYKFKKYEQDGGLWVTLLIEALDQLAPFGTANLEFRQANINMHDIAKSKDMEYIIGQRVEKMVKELRDTIESERTKYKYVPPKELASWQQEWPKAMVSDPEPKKTRKPKKTLTQIADELIHTPRQVNV